VWVADANAQEVADCFGTVVSGGVGDAEELVDVGALHVRRGFFVVEVVDPADGPDDAACPGLGVAFGHRRGALTGQERGEALAIDAVFVGQVPAAEIVDEGGDGGMLFAHGRRNGRGRA
jgi:hypothetical protein